MSLQELKAGKQWVERRFVEIAREFGAPRPLTQEDRWRETEDAFMSHRHHMACYVELSGHLKRGGLTFGEADLESAGAGGQGAQERLSHCIRDALVSLGSATDGSAIEATGSPTRYASRSTYRRAPGWTPAGAAGSALGAMSESVSPASKSKFLRTPR